MLRSQHASIEGSRIIPWDAPTTSERADHIAYLIEQIHLEKEGCYSAGGPSG
jgi:hypothetical protein